MKAPRVLLLTAVTLCAFAANSILCRLALGGGRIDAVSFMALRILSGALALGLVSGTLVRSLRAAFAPEWRRSPPPAGTAGGSWPAALALFVYALAFSLAYVSLHAGVGALILFGAVQVTMIVAAYREGDRLGSLQWLGALAAFAGLVVLVLPGLAAPSPLGALLMAGAGIAWGVYSILGRRARDPVRMTAGNFLRASPLAIAVSVLAHGASHVEVPGVLLALASGVVTSGLGYVVWYAALRDLTTTQASLVQLLVPVLAAAGGVAFLGEVVSLRLVGASVLILGGVALAVSRRR
jgi:drug/metabolite transporter (DMT)-like permease